MCNQNGEGRHQAAPRNDSADSMARTRRVRRSSVALFYEAILAQKKTPEELAKVQVSWVDVRDVSLGHVRALEVPAAGGQPSSFDVANELKLPGVTVPVGTPGSGKSFKYDYWYNNAKARTVFEIKFRDKKTTSKESIENLKSKKIVGAEASAGWQYGWRYCGLCRKPGRDYQDDFAKPPEKRLNYKNCFDGLYRMVRDEGSSSRSRVHPESIVIHTNNLTADYRRYDYFKSELLKTPYFNANIYCHLTASFAADTVSTTSRIMNASGPGSNSTSQVIRNSLKNEGPLFMFKGWLPAWTRLQPTTILILLTLEQLKRAVDWTLNLRDISFALRVNEASTEGGCEGTDVARLLNNCEQALGVEAK
ncbi:hypothetical protein DFH11DRAFT_1746818 [Phellopilus nigrolimitatus]|nr:hypothetical protein DFH11DRAFT_1746818 [Phellopilus nigrolimitatus]